LTIPELFRHGITNTKRLAINSGIRPIRHIRPIVFSIQALCASPFALCTLHKTHRSTDPPPSHRANFQEDGEQFSFSRGRLVLLGKRHKEFGEAKGRKAERAGASESTPGPVRRSAAKTDEGEPNN
jgi:hypothetical protein